MERCLTLEELTEIAGERGSAAEPIDAHLAGCEACRRRLDRARRDERLAHELRSASARGRSTDVDGYELLEELERGGQGTVHRALQRGTRREVALKILDAASAREHHRFEREIELVCRLRHPSIVTIFDSGVVDGRPYYAMELVAGERLDRHVAARGMPRRERLELFVQIADAVAYAHRSGVLHRDLKPENVLVDAEGRPHLVDFGIATALGGGLRITATGEFMGTLAYASPEQVLGRGGELDARTDVYSLGVILYELVTDRLPHERSRHVHETIGRIANQRPIDPSTVAEVDADLRAILLCALARDPAERHPTAEALAGDVRRWLSGSPPALRRPGAWGALLRSARRHRTAIAVTALVLAGAVAGTLTVVREHLRAERQRASAELVRRVFQDVLTAATPQRMGADVRLIEVIEAAAPAIEDQLAGAPDVQAAVQMTIGDTYRRLFMMPEAVRHLGNAVERMRTLGVGGESYAECLYLYGLALSAQSQEGGISAQREALALRRATLDDADPRIARSLRGLGIAQLEEPGGDDAAGRVSLERALARFERAGLALEAAETRLWLARSTSDLAAARAWAEAAVAAFERDAPDDPRLIESLNLCASLTWSAGDFEAAERLLDRSVVLAREHFGEERTPEMLRRYARLEFARGRAETAESLCRQAIVAELERWARRRPADAGELRAMQRRLERETPPGDEPPYAEAFALLRRFHGDGAFELASWSNGLGLVLAAQGREPATEPLLREALAIRCRAWGDDCPVRQRTIDLLAGLLVTQGRCAEARPLLEETLATFERKGEAEGEVAARARRMLASCRDDETAYER